jgi:hypothetical protein
MKYFTDIMSLKRYCAGLINRYENGNLKADVYRNLLSGCNTLLKIFQQIYYEKDLRPLQDRLRELEEYGDEQI